MDKITCSATFETDKETLLELPEKLKIIPKKSIYKQMIAVTDDLVAWINLLPIIRVKMTATKPHEQDQLGEEALPLHISQASVFRASSLILQGYMRIGDRWAHVKTCFALDDGKRDTIITFH